MKWLYSRIPYKNSFSEDGFLFYRRALVLINPHSGTEKGRQVFNESKAILNANGIYYRSIETQPDPFLENFVYSLDQKELISYDFLICVSGDGSAHAILNGFYSRRDIDFKENPLYLTMLPAGSGCLLFENSIKKGALLDFNFNNALYVICHPNKLKMQIRKGIFQKGNGEIFQRLFFLYVHFGFIADCDSGSETLRFLGTPRFEIYAYYKTFNLSKIPAKIFLPLTEQSLPPLDQPIT